MPSHSIVYRMNRAIKIIYLIILISIKSLYSQDFEDLNIKNNYNISQDCDIKVIPLNSDLKLGTYQPGYSGSEIPANDGNGNYLEFMVIGKADEQYTLNANIYSNNTDNSVYIDNWTWEIMDIESPGFYSREFPNQTGVYENIKLIRNENDECNGYAKLRITFKHITISRLALKGSFDFTISVSIVGY